MLPLVWAAAKADPGNDEAWGMAWYIVNTIMKRPDLARRLLAEAMELRPDSLALPFMYGETEWAGGHGDKVAAERWFRKTRELAFEKCGGRLSALKDEKDRETFLFSLNYLGVCARERVDFAALASLKQDAELMGLPNIGYTSITNSIAIARRQAYVDAVRKQFRCGNSEK